MLHDPGKYNLAVTNNLLEPKAVEFTVSQVRTSMKFGAHSPVCKCCKALELGSKVAVETTKFVEQPTSTIEVSGLYICVFYGTAVTTETLLLSETIFTRYLLNQRKNVFYSKPKFCSTLIAQTLKISKYFLCQLFVLRLEVELCPMQKRGRDPAVSRLLKGDYC